LPSSKQAALALPFSAPTGYGLGKSGWVSVKLETGAQLSFEQLRDWLIESYRAVAPKALAARFGESAASASKKPKSKARAKLTAKATAETLSKTAKAAPARSKAGTPAARARRRA
jgi:hypothetical protein